MQLELLKVTHDLLVRPDGEVVLLSEGGLYALSPGSGTPRRLHPAAYPDLRALDLDDEGGVCLAGAEAAYRLDTAAGELRRWHPEDPPDIAQRILYDRRGWTYYWSQQARTLTAYDRAGHRTAMLSRTADLPDQLSEPTAVARDAARTIYVADGPNCRVSRFREDGMPLGRIPVVFNQPYGLLVEPHSGALFVLEHPTDQIDSPVLRVFDREGRRLSYYTLGGPRPLVKQQQPLYGRTHQSPPDEIRPPEGPPSPFRCAAIGGDHLYLCDAQAGELVELALADLLAPDAACVPGLYAYHQHRQVLEADGQRYTVHVGGTLDAARTETAGRAADYCHAMPPGYQPNEAVTLTNVGETVIRNPRLIADDGVDWFSVSRIVESFVEPGMSDEEKARAVWNFHRRKAKYGVAQHNYYAAANESVTQFWNCSGTGSCGTHSYLVRLARAAGLTAEGGGASTKGLGHVLARIYYDGGDHYFDATFNNNVDAPHDRSLATCRRGSVPLRLDNETVASTQDLIEDPYLLFRLNRLPHRIDKHLWYYRTVTVPNRWEGPSADYVDPADMSLELRPGESITFGWGFLGKHLGTFRPSDCVVNGTMAFRPRLGQCLRQADSRDNLTMHETKGETWLCPEDGSKPAHVALRLACPYGIVGGRFGGRFRATEPGAVRLYISPDGDSWQELWRSKRTGTFTHVQEIDHLAALQHHETFHFTDGLMREGPPVYEYYLRYELASGSALAGPFAETDFMANALVLPGLHCGENTLTYVDDNRGPRHIAVTHTWKESSASARPAAPAEAIYPADDGEVCGAEFAFRWAQASAGDHGPIADYEFLLSDRADLAWPLGPCFETFTGGRPELHNPGPTWLVPDKTYYWRVRAMNADGVWGAWSRTWRFAYDGPGRVTQMDYQIVGRTIKLTWKPPERGTSIARYEVYASDEQGFIPTAEDFEFYDGASTGVYPANLLAVVEGRELVVVDEQAERELANRVHYRIVAVDQAGNRGCPSTCISLPHPHIYSTPPTVAVAGMVYQYPLKTLRAGPATAYYDTVKRVSDYRTETLSHRLLEAPPWLRIDERSGLVSGATPTGARGEYRVTIEARGHRVSDGEETGRDRQTYVLQVRQA